jgi:hypothetical protein
MKLQETKKTPIAVIIRRLGSGTNDVSNQSRGADH